MFCNGRIEDLQPHSPVSGIGQRSAPPPADGTARTADLHCDGEAAVALRILATTDLHGFLLGYDYTRDRPAPDTGLSRVANLIAGARREARNVLLFDNGDFLQGSLLVDHWGQRRGIRCGEVHPMIAAMNALGYDAGTPGNHEFNFGLDYLDRVLADARFPFVCANARRRRAEGIGPMLPPWLILERDLEDAEGALHRLRIGVIGFLPPQTASWDRARLGGNLFTRDIVETALVEVPRLRAAGADIVVALAHTGIGSLSEDIHSEDAEHAGLRLAQVVGIDALICGHSHMLFPAPEPAPSGDPAQGQLMGKPAILPGRWGSHLGLIDLTLRRAPGGCWQVGGARSELRPVSERIGPDRVVCLAEEHPQIVALGAEAHAEIKAELSRVLSQTTRPLQSFFSMVAPDSTLGLVALAKAAHVRKCLKGRPEAQLPLLVAVTPMKCGARGGPDYFIDIPAGPLRVRHMLDLYTYPNTVTAVRVTGAEIAEWLERGAAAFLQLRPGVQDQPLLNPGFPSYNFDIFYGLTYEIDPSQPPRYAPDGSLLDPAAQRIRNLCHDGRPVRPEEAFVVVTNSYRSTGTGCFPAAGAVDVPLGSETIVWDVLQETARRHPIVRPRSRPVWTFAPLPGTGAWFETSPRARGRLDEAAGVRLKDGGLTEDGFLKLHLEF